MGYDAKYITAAAIKKLGSAYQLAVRLQLTSQTIDDLRTGKQTPQADHVMLMQKIVREG